MREKKIVAIEKKSYIFSRLDESTSLVSVDQVKTCY